MAYYSGYTLAGSVSGQPAFDVTASPLTSFRLMELALNCMGGGCSWGFGRPANDGSVQQNITAPLFRAENPNDPPSQSQIGSVYFVAPTQPTNFHRRFASSAGVNGATVIWTFPRGFVVNPLCTAVVWNFLSNQTTTPWIVIDE